MTGAKDVLEKVIDANMADGVNPGSYKYRVNLSMETGDERYTFLNTLMWIGSGCRRGHEGRFLPYFVLRSFHTNWPYSHLRLVPCQLGQCPCQPMMSCPLFSEFSFPLQPQICDGKNGVSTLPFLDTRRNVSMIRFFLPRLRSSDSFCLISNHGYITLVFNVSAAVKLILSSAMSVLFISCFFFSWFFF